MDKLKLFLIGCLIFIYSCASQPYIIKSYSNQFSIEQIDSIFISEQLPKTGWIEANVIDDESLDTLFNNVFYREFENDSIKGIKYIHRHFKNNHFFSKQIIMKNK